MKSEIQRLQAKITKLTLDSQISHAKLNEKNENLQYLLSKKNQEITKFKNQLRIIDHQKRKIEKLERELLTSKTSPSINVITVVIYKCLPMFTIGYNIFLSAKLHIFSKNFDNYIFHRLSYLGAQK